MANDGYFIGGSSGSGVTEEQLNTALQGKANVSHTHAISDVTNLQTTLNGKANTNHTHSEYASASHNHDGTYAPASHTHSGYASSTHNHDGVYAPSTHTHTIANITNLSTELGKKLTATQAVAQADSTAIDVAGLVADFNTLLANLRAAGIIGS